jgi:organic radical activating enzyme
MKLRQSDIERVRSTRGRSALLFITDRCPVGCAHCSVDSRRDSRTITDYALFEEILAWLCAEPSLEVVGISGGEPFVERRGLTLASRRLSEAGKLQVIYTSGVWAAAQAPPAWIIEVLGRCSCVYLSTDAFHAMRLSEERYVRAARAVAAAGAWIVVQVIGRDQMVEQAERLLRVAFGPGFTDFCELKITPPVTRGRGSQVFTTAEPIPGHAYGPCSLALSPVVRYDGLVTGCCNESVVMDMGPARLRRRAGTSAEVAMAVTGFHADPLLRAIGTAGLGALTSHPRFADLAEARFSDKCQLCWKMFARSPQAPEPDRLLETINMLSADDEAES